MLRRLRPRVSAFTFIEITIVVVILGMLMAIALPRLRGTFEAAQLTTAARDVAALVRFARDAAALTEGTCEVRFSPDTDTYQLVAFDREGKRVEVNGRRSRRGNEDANPLAIGADMLQPQKLPKHVHFSVIYAAADLTEDTELPRVIFYADGSATPTTVAMQDEGERTIRVEIYRTTGMTRVESGLPPEAPASQKLYYGPGA